MLPESGPIVAALPREEERTCTGCGQGCLVYRQAGAELLCLCCMADQLAAAKAELEEMTERRWRAEGELQVARDALRPFAAASKRYSLSTTDGDIAQGIPLRLSDLRRAAQVLERLPDEERCAGDDEKACEARRPESGHICTRPAGHEGHHAAHVSSNHVAHRWITPTHEEAPHGR